MHLPKTCAFEKCSNFFQPKHGAVKYCCNKCCNASSHLAYKKRNIKALRAKSRKAARKIRENWSEEDRERHKTYCRKYNKKWYAQMSEEDRRERARLQYEKCDKKRKQKLARKLRAERYANDKNFKMRHVLRSRLRQALKRQGVAKSDNTMDLLGCSIEEFKAHMEAQFEPWMSWDNWAHDTWHIDHVKPCAAFDLSDPEQQKECFHYTNMRPLEALTNMRKNKRY